MPKPGLRESGFGRLSVVLSFFFVVGGLRSYVAVVGFAFGNVAEMWVWFFVKVVRCVGLNVVSKQDLALIEKIDRWILSCIVRMFEFLESYRRFVVIYTIRRSN